MDIDNIEAIEYYKTLVESKKHNYTTPKSIKTQIYE